MPAKQGWEGLMGKHQGSPSEAEKPEPKGSLPPACRPSWDAAGRDFQLLSEPAKQTLAKSSRVV